MVRRCRGSTYVVALFAGVLTGQVLLAGTDLRAGPRTALQAVLALRQALPADSKVADQLRHWRAEDHISVGVAVVGDSLAARLFTRAVVNGWAQDDWLARGIPGETVAELVTRVDEVAVRRPGTVVLQSGMNDLSRGASATDVERRMRAVLDALVRRAPDTAVVVLSIPPASPWRVSPATLQAANAGLRRQAERHAGRFVSTFEALASNDGTPAPGVSTDGIHVSDAANDAQLQLLRQLLPRGTS